MGCYKLELVDECETPLMRSVPCAYILTLHETETFPWLHGVAGRTYVQRNRGFSCPKIGPDGSQIDRPNMDIIHAYKTAFTTANGAIGNSPVLVFEDDAVFTKTGKEDLAAVDRFVATSRFSIYSLGSLSLMIPCAGGHWALGGPFGAAHAAIYAGHARSAVIDAKPGKYAQIDASIMAHIPGKFTYKRPIAYQKLDAQSANSDAWCVTCDGGVRDSMLRAFTRAVVVVLSLGTESGWHTLYTLQKIPVLIPIVSVVFIVSLVFLTHAQPYGPYVRPYRG
jgi:hypothetical protein